MSSSRSHAYCMAVRPSPASPMTSISGCELISIFMPSRTVSWSSAITMRSLFITASFFSHNERHAHVEGRAAARLALDVERSAGKSGALAHVEQAHALPPIICHCLIHIKPRAIVGDDQNGLAAAPLQHHLDVAGPGVLRDVVERLLRDTVEHRLGFERQALASGNGGVELGARVEMRAPLLHEIA